ncbi:MAG: hypothetical protein JO340_20370 [Acidobacteriaceae bacterium]|nr:hypothetical protein [Acidobacteriaceae bacterium]
MNTNPITSRFGDLETIAIAIIWIVTGLILVGGDFVGILSLDRIANLWPVALIMVGAVDFVLQDEASQSVRS